jgi:hypothetical protein
LYADDLKLYKRITCVDDIALLQGDINKIQSWANQNHMKFNLDKSKVLRIGKHETPPAYTLNNHTLDVVSEMKDLGVIVDRRLKFDSQCVSVARRASSVVHFFRRKLSSRSIRIARLVIKTFVRPVVDYCAQIWSPGYQKYVQCIEKVQRRATKFLAGVPNLAYEQRLQLLGLTSLADRRTRGDMLLLFGLVRGDFQEPFNGFLCRNPSRVTRGHQFTLLKPRVRTNAGKFSHRFRSITNWNSLPAHVVGAQSVNSFKIQYDRLAEP